MGSWLSSELSLSTEVAQEFDRRRLVQLDHQQLQVKADQLLVDCYRQQHMLSQALQRVATLEVQLLLAESKPSSGPTERHLKWAKELLGTLGAEQQP